MTVTIYGSSDDLLEIEGDIEEEFYISSEFKTLIAFSEGTLLDIYYDSDGIWRIARIVSGGAQFHKEEGNVEYDTPDVVRLTHATIEWVVLGTHKAHRQKKITSEYSSPVC